MFAFLALLFILMVIYFFTSKEGFKSECPLKNLNIPTNVPSSIPPVTNSNIRPSELPGQLPVAPYQQIAAMSPLPYEDTALVKANRQQLINTLELLKGFLSFEAQEISDMSDPTIQLPLTNARSDFHMLQTEVQVLNRNPGLRSNITLSHLNEISSNLAYLQSKVRLIGTAGSFGSLKGPINEFDKVEGFADVSSVLSPKIDILTRHTVTNMFEVRAKLKNTETKQLAVKIVDPTFIVILPNLKKTLIPLTSAKTATSDKDGYELIYNGAESNFTEGKEYFIIDDSKTTTDPALASFIYRKVAPDVEDADVKDQIATIQDLKDFSEKISFEKIRLSASGTTNPIINSRVTALSNLEVYILNTIEKYKTTPEKVPVLKKYIENTFPLLADMSKPLPQLIDTYGLPKWMANLLPSGMANNPEITEEINHLIDKYSETVLNGLSASVSFKYTSPREAESTVNTTGFPSLSDLNNVCNTIQGQQGPQGQQDVKSALANIMAGNTTNANFRGTDVTDALAQNPQDAGRGPSHFDWKQRAQEIEGQINKRGLNPSDFGLMKPDTKVSNDFSWKGYTRMMCTRLQATMDPSLPETCGCPPMNWPGWRIAS